MDSEQEDEPEEESDTSSTGTLEVTTPHATLEELEQEVEQYIRLCMPIPGASAWNAIHVCVCL